MSTPDGLLLGAAAVAGMAVAHPALVERLVAGAVTSSMVLVGTVLPGGAGWFGINLGQPGLARAAIWRGPESAACSFGSAVVHPS